MSDFKSYLIKNGVISVTAGVTIGFATVTFIKSLVADLVLPLVFLVIVKGTGTVSTNASGFFGKFLTKKDFLFTNFISEVITWRLIVFVALMILNFIYDHYIQNKPIINQESIQKLFAPEFFNVQKEEEPLWGASD